MEGNEMNTKELIKRYEILEETRAQLRCMNRFPECADMHATFAEGLLTAYEIITGIDIPLEMKAVCAERDSVNFEINLNNDKLIEKIAAIADKADNAIDHDDDAAFNAFRKECETLIDVASFGRSDWYCKLEDRVIDYRTFGSHEIG